MAIQGTPYRSMILLGGDFNASLLPHSPHVGHGVLAGSAGIDLEQERHALNELFCRHRLTVLNSWGRRQATYEHPTGNSQIDFLVVRQQVADGVSKKAGPTSSGLAEWRKAGHRLVGGSLRAEWRPWKRMPSQQPRGPVLQQLDSREESVAALRALVKSKCPGRTKRPVLPPRDGVSLDIECHWKLRKMLRQLGGVYLLRNAFRAMALHAKAQRAHRALKKACRQKKRDRLCMGCSRLNKRLSAKMARPFMLLLSWFPPSPLSLKLNSGTRAG